MSNSNNSNNTNSDSNASEPELPTDTVENNESDGNLQNATEEAANDNGNGRESRGYGSSDSEEIDDFNGRDPDNSEDQHQGYGSSDSEEIGDVNGREPDNAEDQHQHVVPVENQVGAVARGVQIVYNRVGRPRFDVAHNFFYPLNREPDALANHQRELDNNFNAQLLQLLQFWWLTHEYVPEDPPLVPQVPDFFEFRLSTILRTIQFMLNFFNGHWYRFSINGGNIAGHLPVYSVDCNTRNARLDPNMFPLITSFQFQDALGGFFSRACNTEMRGENGGNNNINFQMFWPFHINETGMNFRVVAHATRFVEQEGLTLLEALLFFYLRSSAIHLEAEDIAAVFGYYPQDSIMEIMNNMDEFINLHGRNVYNELQISNFFGGYIRHLFRAFFLPTVPRLNRNAINNGVPHPFFDAANNFGLEREERNEEVEGENIDEDIDEDFEENEEEEEGEQIVAREELNEEVEGENIDQEIDEDDEEDAQQEMRMALFQDGAKKRPRNV
ncbi:predicted protein [Chaetoceros tenuissimus]|uniref:Uncharacterized protein n=1 Tax=Chaetoceros tenuissimus TaxID=426638 RepID=A0AAD3CN07_9STRA|nr:predicted protein [Chaetoceros tenuissimus]